MPLFKAVATVRTATGDLESAVLIGVDDSSLVGLPARVVMGDIEELRRPDAVAVGEDGFGKVGEARQYR